MEGRVVASLVLSAAVLAYLGSKLWGFQRGSSAAYVERMIRHAHAEKDLVEHPIQIVKPEVVKVTENIYMAIGYALANSIMLIGPDGVVIVDVTESYESGQEVFAAFRNITKKPVRAIIYTHNHADHTYGAKAFVEDPQNPPDIWAHEGILKEFKRTFSSVNAAFVTRAVRQFGVLLPDEITLGRGIGQMLRVGGHHTIGILFPNKYVNRRVTEVNIAGLQLSIVHIPGETDDQIGVWYPDQKAFLCADDIYRAFPNLYAIRGTPNRDLMQWAESIDLMLRFKPEYLVPSHTNPVIGWQSIQDILVPYRDAIQYVHDQTIRHINDGLSPDEIAEKIKLPTSLASHPYLKEFYGTVGWSSKSVFNAYLGWFNGNAVYLNPLTEKTRAEKMVKLVGVNKLIESAREAYKNKDFQWALELASHILLVNSANSEAKEIKIDSLMALGSRQISRNGRNYYMTAAFEEAYEITAKGDNENKNRQTAVQYFPIKVLFDSMPVRFKPEECGTVLSTVVFDFLDTGIKVTLRIRNSVVIILYADSDTCDVRVTMKEAVFREMIGSKMRALSAYGTGELKVEGGVMQFRNIMGCFQS